MAVTEIEPRDYSISDAAALTGLSVHTLRSTGMSLRQIREYAEMVRGGDGNEVEGCN